MAASPKLRQHVGSTARFGASPAEFPNEAAAPQVDHIPAELRECPQWLVWREVERPGKNKPDKLPFNPHTGKMASSTDPTTWSDYRTARAAVPRSHVGGVGFVFTPADPYAGIDLDDCRDPQTGVIAPWAQRIIVQLHSYAEVSPSKTGVKIWVRAKLPPDAKHKIDYQTGSVEMYDRARYFTVTGDHIQGAAVTIEDRQAELVSVYSSVFGKVESVPPENNAATEATPLQVEELASPSPTQGRQIPEGQRTPTLFRKGCSYRGRGAGQEEIESHLLRMNQERCNPPLNESKVRRIAGEIFEQYPPGQVRVDASQPFAEFVVSACQKNNLEFMQHNQRAKWLSPMFTFTRLIKGRPEVSGMDPSQAVRLIEQEVGTEFWKRFAGGNVCADPQVQFVIEWNAVRSPAGNGGTLALAWEEAQQNPVTPPHSYSPKYAQCVSLLAVLQRKAGEGKQFAAPQVSIAKLLGVDYTTVGHYIKLAIKDGLLELRKKFVRQQMAAEYVLDLALLEVHSSPDSYQSDQTRQDLTGLTDLSGLAGSTDSTGASGVSVDSGISDNSVDSGRNVQQPLDEAIPEVDDSAGDTIPPVGQPVISGGYAEGAL